MRPPFALLPLLLAAAAPAGDPPPAPVVSLAKPAEPPAVTELKARPGRAAKLTADPAAGKVIRWALADPTAADLIPSPDGQAATFVAPTPGRYLVLAYTAAGDVPSDPCRVVVIVGDAPAPPPAPVDPPAPSPADPLTRKLRDAYAADPAAVGKKADQLAYLAELYRQAEGFARASEVTTVGQVIERIRATAAGLKIDGLPEVRRAVAAELAAAFPADVDLTADNRERLAALFARIGASLKAAGQ